MKILGIFRKIKARMAFRLVIAICVPLVVICMGCGGGGGGGSSKDPPVPVSQTRDATGLWTIGMTKSFDSDDPATVGERGTGELNITQHGDDIRIIITIGGTEYVLNGTFSGGTYVFSGDLGQIQSPDGQWGHTTMDGTFGLLSETDLTGDYTVEWTDGIWIHSEQWDLTGSTQSHLCNYGLGYNHLMYRNYEDAENRYQGVIGIDDNGGPIQGTDIVGIRMTDSGGNVVHPAGGGFYDEDYLRWDCRSAPCRQWMLSRDTGIARRYALLPAGIYSMEIEMINGQVLAAGCDYSGRYVLPYISSTDMRSAWSAGDLVLSWVIPDTDPAWQNVRIMRIDLFDNDSNIVLKVMVRTNATTVTIPAALVDQAARLHGGSSLAWWQIQTRAISADDMNYARGYSATIAVAGHAAPIVTGQWAGTAGFGTFSFDVTSDGAGVQACTVNLTDYTCYPATYNGQMAVTFTPPRDITGREMNLSVSFSPPDNDVLSIEGTFDNSGNAITGSFSFFNGSSLCFGDWQAAPVTAN